jgi:hypothetical protein
MPPLQPPHRLPAADTYIHSQATWLEGQAAARNRGRVESERMFATTVPLANQTIQPGERNANSNVGCRVECSSSPIVTAWRRTPSTTFAHHRHVAHA